MLETETLPNDLESIWLPFTPNRRLQGAAAPARASAEGMYYCDQEGRKILDGISGLWCVNAGHARKPIAEAIRAQAAELDYAPTFHFAPSQGRAARGPDLRARAQGSRQRLLLQFGLGSRRHRDEDRARLFRARRARAERFRFVGRERAYHGMNFGGMSVGGLPNNQQAFGPLLPGTDHPFRCPTTAAKHRFTKGELKRRRALRRRAGEDRRRVRRRHHCRGDRRADDRFGRRLPPPKGYLKRLRAICDKHGILLIFDEVITGFGRLGYALAAERYGVVPDMITFAKGVTNGAVPMGGVVVKGAHL